MSTTLRRILSLIGGVLVLAAFAIPLLVATDPGEGEDAQLSLITAIPALFGAGGGPYQGEGRIAGVLVGIFAVVVAVTGVLALIAAAAPRPRIRLALRAASILLLAGCVGASLLVLALALHFEGRALWFSPGVASATIGSIAALISTLVRSPAADTTTPGA